jgi:hypothetical protein
MNSKDALTAIMSNLRKKRKSKDDPRPRLTFADAATEIAQALRIKHEAAAMTLYGLCATGNVLCLNDQGEVLEPDECNVRELCGAAFVIADGIRSFLTDWSPDPRPEKRKGVIRALFDEGHNPPRTIEWEPFCCQVRDKCNGWLPKGKNPKARIAPGFSVKQIQRIVKDLRAK